MNTTCLIRLDRFRIGPLEDPPTARTLWTVRSRKGCLTCNHPLRWALEREMVAGRSWAAIVRDLPEDAGLTGRNLRDHFAAGHLPVFEPAVQEHVTRQSQVPGEAVAPSVAKLADTLGFAQTVVTRVSERLIAGDVQPSIRDGLAAAEHLLRYAPVDTRLRRRSHVGCVRRVSRHGAGHPRRRDLD